MPFSIKNKFTFLELLIVMGIVGILSVATAPYVLKVIDHSRMTKCQSNINQISIAVKIYTENHGRPPSSLDEPEIIDMLQGTDVFYCPSSDLHYENYYVGRKTRELNPYIIGCPSHEKNQVYKHPVNEANVICKSGLIKLDGELILPGTEVSGQILEFEDGTVVNLNGSSVLVIASFNYNGQLHTVIRLLERNVPQKIKVTVNKGSHFTVRTPSAVAGVRGTEFNVETSYADGGDSIETLVEVEEGIVFFEDEKGISDDLFGGDSGHLNLNKRFTQKDPLAKKLRHEKDVKNKKEKEERKTGKDSRPDRIPDRSEDPPRSPPPHNPDPSQTSRSSEHQNDESSDSDSRSPGRSNSSDSQDDGDQPSNDNGTDTPENPSDSEIGRGSESDDDEDEGGNSNSERSRGNNNSEDVDNDRGDSERSQRGGRGGREDFDPHNNGRGRDDEIHNH